MSDYKVLPFSGGPHVAVEIFRVTRAGTGQRLEAPLEPTGDLSVLAVRQAALDRMAEIVDEHGVEATPPGETHLRGGSWSPWQPRPPRLEELARPDIGPGPSLQLTAVPLGASPERREETRRYYAQRFGLTPDATWVEVTHARDELNRKSLANDLNLPETASWSVVRHAQHEKNRRSYAASAGQPSTASWDELERVRQDRSLQPGVTQRNTEDE